MMRWSLSLTVVLLTDCWPGVKRGMCVLAGTRMSTVEEVVGLLKTALCNGLTLEHTSVAVFIRESTPS